MAHEPFPSSSTDLSAPAPEADVGGGAGAGRSGPEVAAVLALAGRLGLPILEPRILGSGANLVLHLAPSPVVARVATLTADMRGGAMDYLRRERDITRALAERGVNVVAPTDLVDPGPHDVGGRACLLLSHRRLRPVDLDSDRDAEIVGYSLADLLTALADLPTTVGSGADGQPWDEIDTLLATVGPTTDHRAIDRIAGAVQTLREHEPEDACRLVHGDAHRVNVAFTGREVIWFDFEDANRRPQAWDLATLRRAWPAAGDAACRRLGVDPDHYSMRWHHELREVYALLWSLLYAQRRIRQSRPTAKRLQDWLARPDVRHALGRSGPV